MKKLIVGASIIGLLAVAAPAFADDATTTPVMSIGGHHAPDSVMQGLLSPSDYQLFIAKRVGVAPVEVTVQSLILQIIDLLKQEIVLLQQGQQ